jgi:hypothetical protein
MEHVLATAFKLAKYVLAIGVLFAVAYLKLDAISTISVVVWTLALTGTAIALDIRK